MIPNLFSDVRAAIVAVGVGLVALIGGIAVAGLPKSVPDDIVISDIRPVSTSTTAAGTSPPTSTQLSQETSPNPDGIRNGRTPDDEGSTATARATTTVASTAARTAVVTGPTLVPETQLRVVVANAGGRNGLAAQYTDVVAGFGYASVEPANATGPRDTSVVYWSPGREGEARRLAEQLGVGVVEPTPSERFVLGNFVADIWAIIGRDLADR